MQDIHALQSLFRNHDDHAVADQSGARPLQDILQHPESRSTLQAGCAAYLKPKEQHCQLTVDSWKQQEILAKVAIVEQRKLDAERRALAKYLQQCKLELLQTIMCTATQPLAEDTVKVSLSTKCTCSYVRLLLAHQFGTSIWHINECTIS